MNLSNKLESVRIEVNACGVSEKKSIFVKDLNELNYPAIDGQECVLERKRKTTVF